MKLKIEWIVKANDYYKNIKFHRERIIEFPSEKWNKIIAKELPSSLYYRDLERFIQWGERLEIELFDGYEDFYKLLVELNNAAGTCPDDMASWYPIYSRIVIKDNKLFSFGCRWDNTVISAIDEGD